MLSSGVDSADAPHKSLTLNSDQVPQAFSHFTIAYSERPLSQFVGPDGTRGRCLVCDLQGCFDKRQNTFLLSDPVIHSDLGQAHLFGATDMGRRGIDAFLRSHRCNDVCRLLKLPENTAFVEDNVGQLENSSVNTSLISVVQTNHLVERLGEREITKREVQAAKKHGDKFRQASGRIKHEHGDVRYITSKDMKVGVTGIRLDKAPTVQPPTALQPRPGAASVSVTPETPEAPSAFAVPPQANLRMPPPQTPLPGRGGRGGRGSRGGRGNGSDLDYTPRSDLVAQAAPWLRFPTADEAACMPAMEEASHETAFSHTATTAALSDASDAVRAEFAVGEPVESTADRDSDKPHVREAAVIEIAQPVLSEEERETARLEELLADMAQQVAIGRPLHAWYMELRLIDQLLLNSRLSTAESEEIRRGGADGEAVFMEVVTIRGGSNGRGSSASKAQGGGSNGDSSSSAGTGGGGGKGEATRPLRSGLFSALEKAGEHGDALSRSQLKKKKYAMESEGELEQEESIAADELEQQLSKAHSIDTTGRTNRRAAVKHPKFSSSQIEEMSVRQIKRALEIRGESFDRAWVGRPDEKKLLQQHASKLRSMCTDASSARFFKDVAKHEVGVDAVVDAIVSTNPQSKAAEKHGKDAQEAEHEAEQNDRRRKIAAEAERRRADMEEAERRDRERERRRKIAEAIDQQRLDKAQGNLEANIKKSLKRTDASASQKRGNASGSPGVGDVSPKHGDASPTMAPAAGNEFAGSQGSSAHPDAPSPRHESAAKASTLTEVAEPLNFEFATDTGAMTDAAAVVEVTAVAKQPDWLACLLNEADQSARDVLTQFQPAENGARGAEAAMGRANAQAMSSIAGEGLVVAVDVEKAVQAEQTADAARAASAKAALVASAVACTGSGALATGSSTTTTIHTKSGACSKEVNYVTSSVASSSEAMDGVFAALQAYVTGCGGEISASSGLAAFYKHAGSDGDQFKTVMRSMGPKGKAGWYEKHGLIFERRQVGGDVIRLRQPVATAEHSTPVATVAPATLAIAAPPISPSLLAAASRDAHAQLRSTPARTEPYPSLSAAALEVAEAESTPSPTASVKAFFVAAQSSMGAVIPQEPIRTAELRGQIVPQFDPAGENCADERLGWRGAVAGAPASESESSAEQLARLRREADESARELLAQRESRSAFSSA